MTIVDLKGVSEPVSKLIECVSKGIGKLYQPTATIKEAKAQKEAALILVQGEIEQRELLQRAAHRLMYIKGRRQQIVESITEQAKAQLPSSVSEEPVSEDWMVQFFESCKDVGETDLQKLWARILAGEVAKPRTFSRRTMELLKTFDRQDAEVFTLFCSGSFADSDGGHIAFQTDATYAHLRQQFGNADVAGHLTTLGLLSSGSGMVNLSAVNGWKLSYFGKNYRLSAPPPPGKTASGLQLLEEVVGITSFTAVGEELFAVVSAMEVPNFVKMQSEELEDHKIKFLEVV